MAKCVEKIKNLLRAVKRNPVRSKREKDKNEKECSKEVGPRSDHTDSSEDSEKGSVGDCAHRDINDSKVVVDYSSKTDCTVEVSVPNAAQEYSSEIITSESVKWCEVYKCENNSEENDPSGKIISPFINDSELDNYYAQGVSRFELQALICDISEKVVSEYPSFYDFCIIASEEDYDAADSLKHYLCNTFGLTGCMVNDGFLRAGSDIFTSFETMMCRSTKVFFYLTDNFNANIFYRRIQSGAVFQSLMSSARANREKCVPIFPHGVPSYIPLPLSGIAGLHPQSQISLRQSINATFTAPVRQKRKNLELQNNENRRLMCLEYFQLSVKQILDKKQYKNSAFTGSNRNSNCSLSDMDINGASTEMQVDQSIADSIATLPVEEDTRSDLMQLISKSNTLPSSCVNVIGSSAVTVGNQITLNITVNPPNNKTISDSDDSNSEEEEQEFTE